jgi:hypothetical protein
MVRTGTLTTMERYLSIRLSSKKGGTRGGSRMFGLRRKTPRLTRDEAPVQPDVITIATGMPMSGDERHKIVTALGPGYRVVDIREAPLDTTLIVVGPCSAGAIRELTATFPHARVLVIERQGATTAGPVVRALRAGAVAYVVAEADQNHLPASHVAA